MNAKQFEKKWMEVQGLQNNRAKIRQIENGRYRHPFAEDYAQYKRAQMFLEVFPRKQFSRAFYNHLKWVFKVDPDDLWGQMKAIIEKYE